MKGEKTLDLFKLHSKEDNKDPRSWILASGKCLRKNIDFLIKEISKNYNNTQIINKISSKIGINILLLNNKNPTNLGDEIKRKKREYNLNKEIIANKTGTSIGDWSLIEEGKHFPSCRKLNKIYRELGKSKLIQVNCLKNDFCFKKIIILYNSLFNKKEEIPIIIIKELFYLYKNNNKQDIQKKKLNLINSIEYLRLNQHCSEKIKSILKLNKNLAKIIGAFCADGSLSPPDMLRWEEEHLSNMQALSKWFKKSFNKDLNIEKSKRGRSSWTIKFRSKIIKRYLTEFFQFKPGIKKYSVREPKIIRQSSLDIQRAFALGAMMFDGSVYCNGRAGFGVVSKKFRDDLVNIIKKDNITNFTKSKLIKREDGFKHKPIYTINFNITKERNDKKLLSYFEKGTIKWIKLKDHIYGFNNKVKDLNEAKYILKIYYYKRLNNLKISDLLDILKIKKKFDVYDIIKITNTPRGTMCNQLNMFSKFKILNKERENRRIKYIYNDNILEWKLPNITLHPNQDPL